ncbi:MAG: anti-sigma factor family protein [Dehalococcoidia bacterium]
MLKALVQFRHRRLRRDLSAYLDDALGDRARRHLEAHLDCCPACRQELAQLRLAAQALRSLPMADVPRSFALAAPPVAQPRPTARRLEFGLRLATATAAFALALVLIGDFAGLTGNGQEQQEAVPIRATEETPGLMEAVPTETPEPPSAWSVPGITDSQREEPTPAGYGAAEGEEAADKASAVLEDEGGPSRQDIVRWLEIGLGAGLGMLVILWAFALLRRRIGNRT